MSQQTRSVPPSAVAPASLAGTRENVGSSACRPGVETWFVVAYAQVWTVASIAIVMSVRDELRAGGPGRLGPCHGLRATGTLSSSPRRPRDSSRVRCQVGLDMVLDIAVAGVTGDVEARRLSVHGAPGSSRTGWRGHF